MPAPETFEVFAIKYATHDRDAAHNFLYPTDIHDGPMPIDYFVVASDACHVYANKDPVHPFPIVLHVSKTIEASPSALHAM